MTHLTDQTTSKEEITNKITDYVLTTTFSDPGKISNNTMIFKEGILDSMGLMNLISFLEEDLKIPIMETDLEEENFESINAMAEFVLSRI